MTWRAAALPALGVALIVLTALVLLLPIPGQIEIWDERRTAFIALSLAGGCVYLAGSWIVLRPAGSPWRGSRWGLAVIIAVAVVIRALAWTTPPILSSDIFRYVWDGRVQMAGINPYGHLPVDPVLAHLRDDPAIAPSVEAGTVFIYMNRVATAPTIYPPVAQGLFLLMAALKPGIWPMKLLMIVLEGIAIASMAALLAMAGRPREHILLYAWAPLPVWEFAGNGHIDAASLGFLALALLAAAKRKTLLAGVMLGAATLCKFLPLVVTPALWRPLTRPFWPPRDWRLPLGLGLVIVVGYVCYIGAGWGVLGYLSGYGAEEGLSSGSGILWLRLLALIGPLPGWAGKLYLALAAIGLASLALNIARLTLPNEPGARALALGRGSLALAGAVMAAMTPHYAWYLCWLPWLACLYPSRGVFCLTTLAAFLYWDPGQDRVLWPTLVYLPAALLALRDVRNPLR